jgi:ribosome-binding protein aMBF1 (putative translation factor)
MNSIHIAPTRESIAGQLKIAVEEAIEAKRLSFTRLAADINVSESTLRRFVEGTSEPSYRQIVTAARLLDKPVDWFVGA